MPFSALRSARAPASKATRVVSARVPGIEIRWIGRPFGAVVVEMLGRAVKLLHRAVVAEQTRRAATVAGVA
jgi:hypothetical protein